MSQAGYTPIQLYHSTTAAAVPTAGNLVNGELAINITDGKLYFKSNAGVVTLIAGSGGGGPAAGSNTQIQFNNSGVFGASADLTWNGSTLGVTGAVTISTIASFGAGAAATPSIAANGDLNTGLFFPAADTLAASTGGSERMRIDSSGNVGIGTSSPARKLDVSDDASIYGVRVGRGAGAVATNTALGSSALNSNTSGSSNTALGQGALSSNTSGLQNTASGVSALFTNTTGSYNTASGQTALYSNTTGGLNAALGQAALSFNTTGSYNSAVGQSALLSNTSGELNAALGQAALYSNTAGSYNTASGASALQNSTTGTQNTANGYAALFNNTTGICNVGHGAQSLYNNTTGSGNTMINGQNSGGSYSPVFNPTTENNRFCMGSTSVTNAYVQVAWTVVSDARDKTDFAPVPHGLQFVSQLKPTAYRYKVDRDSTEAHGPLRYGFKAQDILALEGENSVIVDAEQPDKLRFNDQSLLAVLVKAIQELKAEFDEYKATHP